MCERVWFSCEGFELIETNQFPTGLSAGTANVLEIFMPEMNYTDNWTEFDTIATPLKFISIFVVFTSIFLAQPKKERTDEEMGYPSSLQNEEWIQVKSVNQDGIFKQDLSIEKTYTSSNPHNDFLIISHRRWWFQPPDGSTQKQSR